MLAPSSDALPVLRRWRSEEAELSWSFTPPPPKKGQDAGAVVDGKLTVVGFRGQKLRPIFFAEAQQSSNLGRSHTSWARFKRFFASDSAPRVPPSSANATVIAHGSITGGEPVDTEDDVLHIQKLPDFDGRLRARDCELLLQYLTVPYLRIPLVLQFFSDPLRICGCLAR